MALDHPRRARRSRACSSSAMEQYNQLFTMHGTIMLLLFATPLFVGFGQRDHAAADRRARRRVPAPEHARLLAVPVRRHRSCCVGFLTPGGAAAFGWFAYAPLSQRDLLAERRRRPVARSAWPWAAWAPSSARVNFITTIFCMRAPGMTMFRMPIFTWNDPASRASWCSWPSRCWPRRSSCSSASTASSAPWSSTPTTAAPILWQHLFWFFGHPEVYILALPFFGIASEIIPVFSRKPIFGYKGLVFATIAIAALSVAVWAHHMYVTGAVYLPFFAFMTMLIAVPTGVKFFNWIGTMWRGLGAASRRRCCSPSASSSRSCSAASPASSSSAPPLDFHVSDTYFVVAHFHYIGLRHRRVPDVRRLLLLVAEDDRPDARRAAGQDALLAAVHRLPDDVPRPALARRRGHAAPLRRLPARRRLHAAQPDLDRRLGDPRRCRRCRSSATSTRRWRHARRMVDGRRPVGLGRLAGVGDVLPAAAAQLRRRSRAIRSERPAFDLHHPELVDVATPSAQQVLDRSWRTAGEGSRTREDRRPPLRRRRGFFVLVASSTG